MRFQLWSNQITKFSSTVSPQLSGQVCISERWQQGTSLSLLCCRVCLQTARKTCEERVLTTRIWLTEPINTWRMPKGFVQSLPAYSFVCDDFLLLLFFFVFCFHSLYLYKTETLPGCRWEYRNINCRKTGHVRAISTILQIRTVQKAGVKVLSENLWNLQYEVKWTRRKVSTGEIKFNWNKTVWRYRGRDWNHHPKQTCDVCPTPTLLQVSTVQGKGVEILSEDVWGVQWDKGAWWRKYTGDTQWTK